MHNSEQWLHNMRSLLHHNVPRFVGYILARGGVTEDEWHWLQCEDEDFNYPMHLIDRADQYLLYPKNEEIFKKGLFVLVKALAIMAFVPGGVRIFDLHFSSVIENFVCEDGSQET